MNLKEKPDNLQELSGFFFHKSKEQGYKKPKPLNNDLIDVNIRCYFSQVSNT